GHQGRDRWPLYCLYRDGREAQNVLSRARNRAPFHNDGYALHKCSGAHSTTRKDPTLPAACVYVIPALVAVLPLANGQLAYLCFTSLSSRKNLLKRVLTNYMIKFDLINLPLVVSTALRYNKNLAP